MSKPYLSNDALEKGGVYRVAGVTLWGRVLGRPRVTLELLQGEMRVIVGNERRLGLWSALWRVVIEGGSFAVLKMSTSGRLGGESLI